MSWGAVQKGLGQEVGGGLAGPESSCLPLEKEEEGLGRYFWLCADSDHDLG